MSKRLRKEGQSPEEEKEPDEGMLVDESMSSDEEDEGLEKTLKGIYEKYRANRRSSNPVSGSYPSPKQINAPSRSGKKKQTVELAIARMPGQLVDHPQFIKALEKYKVGRIQYLPEEGSNEIDALLVAVAALPNKLNILNNIVPITKAEDMTEDQRRTFRRLID